MAGDKSCRLFFYLVEKLSPGLGSQASVHLENVTPVDLRQLGRMDGYITHNHGPLACRNDSQAHMAGRMAWGRYGCYLVGQGLLPCYQLKYAQILQGSEGLFPELKGKCS
jgi:hypothetical protein